MDDEVRKIRAGTEARNALERVARWRTVFVGRILGTRAKDNGPVKGYRDLFEKLIILRVEVTALTDVLRRRGLLDDVEFADAIAREADLLSADYEKLFPGFKATDIGMEMDLEVAAKTTEGWPP